MPEISPQLATLIMFGGIFVLLFTGFPLAFVLGFLALIVGITVWGPGIADVFYQRMWGFMTGYIVLAIPLFIFMGVMLQYSGISEKLYDVLYVWLGGFKGGLSVVTIALATVIAACVGVVAASITMLVLVALPSMMEKGYSKSLATGTIVAGGCLGILIPPSIMLVLYGPMSGVSVGKLFMGAIFPGLIISGLYIAYISIRCYFQPHLAPPVPVEERIGSFWRKTWNLIVALFPTAILILSVLGVIFLGIAPPTEAAGAGAFVSILLVIAYRKFSFKVLRDVSRETFRMSGYIFMIMAMAVAFVSVFMGVGGRQVVIDLLLAAPGGAWGVFATIMLIIFGLGMLINWMAIVFLMVPVITPVAAEMGFDPVWFAIMICINLNVAFMTPPMAGGIFLCKGAADPKFGITIADIIRGVLPFVAIVLFALVVFALYPPIITWLPQQMIR